MCPQERSTAAGATTAVEEMTAAMAEVAITMEDLEENDELWDDERHETIRCKWVADGSRTLDEVIEKLEDFIETIRKYQRDGYELIAEMNDDYGHMWRQDRAGGGDGDGG